MNIRLLAISIFALLAACQPPDPVIKYTGLHSSHTLNSIDYNVVVGRVADPETGEGVPGAYVDCAYADWNLN